MNSVNQGEVLTGDFLSKNSEDRITGQENSYRTKKNRPNKYMTEKLTIPGN
jgi:hypothetical protein